MAYIKGHPNCKPGECFSGECHVVSCAIYQGYEEPEIVEDDDVTSTDETETSKQQ